MRSLLDKILENTKLNIFIPFGYALLIYSLYLIFGEAKNWLSALLTAPIIMVIWFFFLFFVALGYGMGFAYVVIIYLYGHK